MLMSLTQMGPLPLIGERALSLPLLLLVHYHLDHVLYHVMGGHAALKKVLGKRCIGKDARRTISATNNLKPSPCSSRRAL